MKSTLLGIGSFFCSGCVILVLVAVILLPLFVEMEDEIPVALRPVVIVVLLCLLPAVLGTWFFMIYDTIHAIANPDLTEGAKVGWIVALWCLNVFVIPIYWMKFQRRKRSPTSSS